MRWHQTAHLQRLHHYKHLLVGWIMDQDNNKTVQHPMPGEMQQGQGMVRQR